MKHIISPSKKQQLSWLSVSSFAKDWENEKDAIYDNWQEHYHVPEGSKRMESLNYMHVIKGERLEETVCDLTDKEVIFEKPRQVAIRVFRNDERKEDKFEIEIITPGGQIHTISRHKSLEEAETEYQKLVKDVESGQKKIKISMSKDLAVSIC